VSELRADARRNRDAVLAAAKEVFASSGTGVPLDEIARRAGVGAGTVYRHFPSKEALLRAVLVSRLRDLTDRARSLLDAPDPGSAFFEYAAHVVEEGTAKHDLIDALASTGAPVAAADLAETHDFRAALAALLRRAQDAGAVRPDLTQPQLSALLVGVSLAARTNLGDTGALRVVLDGLRPQP
jgi:AcrR family transcriptional regulator